MMRWESSIVRGMGSFRIKLLLFISSGSVAGLISWLTGWKFSSVWYATAMLTVFVFLCTWAASELWADLGPKRN